MSESDNTEVKENLKEMRLLNEKINSLLEQRTELNTKCFGLTENLDYERESLENLKTEIDYRKKKLKEVEKKLLSITNNASKSESKKYTLELKNDMIKKNLEEIFSANLPELVNLYNNDNLELNENSDFYNLFFESVMVFYDSSQRSKNNSRNLKYNNDNNNNNNNISISNVCNNRPKEQSFRISKKTTFRQLKSTVCKFWNLPNEGEYILCDDAEALIYDEEMQVDKYLREYSALANKLKLVNLETLKTRSRLLDIQDQRIRIENTFKKNTHNKANFGLPGASAKESSESIISKTKLFLSEFMGIKNYLVKNGLEREIMVSAGSAPQDNQNDSKNMLKNMETSFPMLIILLILYIFTLLFLFTSRSVPTNFNYNQNLRNIFDNSQVNSYTELYRYLVDKIGILYFQGDNLKNVFANLTESLVEPFQAMNYTRFISDKPTTKNFTTKDPFDYSKVRNEENKRINITRFYFEYYDSYKHSNFFSIVDKFNIITSKVAAKKCSEHEAVKDLIGDAVCHEVFHDRRTSTKDNSNGLLYKSAVNNNPFNWEDEEPDKYKVFYDFGYRRNYIMNITLSVETLTGRYDGSGFHSYFDNDCDSCSILTMMLFLYEKLPVHASFDKFIKDESEFKPKDNIDNYFFVGPDVRNIMLLFTIFDDDSQLFTYCNISFDFLPTGIIIPNVPVFKNYISDIYLNQQIPITSDIIRTLTIIFFVFIQVFEMRRKIIEAEKWWHGFLDLGFALNVLMVGIFWTSIITKYSDFRRNVGNVFDNSKYLDFNLLCDKYANLFVLESVFFCLVSLKFLVFLNLNKNFGLVYATISSAIRVFAQYSIFYLIFLIGYAFLFYILFGPYLIEFSEFKSSIVQVLLFTMGYIDIKKLIAFNTHWTVFFICLFYLFVLFFMFTVFNCIYIESLRRYIVIYGYPDDHKHKKWTMAEFTVWCTNIISTPNKKDSNKKK